MISFDYDAWCENDEDGRQMLADCEWHYWDTQRQATALLTLPGAVALARDIAKELAGLVQTHATPDGRTTLKAVLYETVGEHVLTLAFKNDGNEGVLHQPFGMNGFIALTQARDDACRAFEGLLAANSTK